MEYKIKVSQLEALFLSDTISMFQHGPPMADKPIAASAGAMFPNLLLKIGACVVYADANKGTGDMDLELTEDELWAVREVAKTSAVVGSARVGLTLLVKVYSELLRDFPGLAIGGKSVQAPEVSVSDLIPGLENEVGE